MSDRFIIDSHAHIDSHKYSDSERFDILKTLDQNKILAIINPSCDLDSARAVSKLASEFDRLYAMVGTHPHDAKFYDKNVRAEYKKIALNNHKIVAVGEIGLDYHYNFSEPEDQIRVFIDQINLAKELKLPIVIHSREALEDTFNILKEHALDMKVLMHSFNEDWQYCKKYIDMGFFISFGGMITFKKVENLIEAVKNVPLDRILLETDAPYLTPTPHRGKKNHPKYTRIVAEKIAEIRGEDVDKIIEQTNKNTIEFYGLNI